MKAFLHIGAGKTGTSAIQVALAQNREELGARGLLYPALPAGADDRAARGEISSGNAQMLGWYCNPNSPSREFTREGVACWITESAAEARGRNLLFSSESLQFARPDSATELVGLLRGEGYEPEVIFYVRHMLDHAVAEYLQHLKFGFARLAQRERAGTLPGFVRLYRCQFARSIGAFAAVLPRDALHVRLYDSERPRLLAGFFGILGIEAPAAGAADAANRVVNRSLTPEELPLFEALARLPDGVRMCRQLTELLLNSPAATSAPFRVSEADFQVFERRNAPVLEEMNSVWLPGADKLRLRSDRIVIGGAVMPTAEQMATTYAETLAAVLRGLDTQRRARATRDGRPRPRG